MSSLKWERGTDWIAYSQFFNNIETFPEGQYERFYTLLNKITHSILPDYTFFLFIQSILVYIPMAYVIHKYSPYPIFTLLIWFSIGFAGIFSVRQTIAISLILFSYKYIIDRKFIPFLVIVMTASMFHRTALIFIPAYFLYDHYFSKKNIFIILIISFCIGGILAFLLQKLAGIGMGIITIKLNAYLDADKTDSVGSNFTPFQTMIRGISYRLVIFLLIVFYLFEYYKKNQQIRYLLNLYFYGIIIFIVLVPIAVGFGRFAVFFEIFQILLFPQFLSLMKNRINKNITFFILCVYFVFRLQSNIFAYKDLYIPYKSVFNKELPVKL